MSDRLACPKCGCAHLPVRYTRHRDGYTQRVRECRHCQRRIITREKLAGVVARRLQAAIRTDL
ncbi:MAG: hypothetical protein ACOCYE_02015 [Pseudomonadota bacterium]